MKGRKKDLALNIAQNVLAGKECGKAGEKLHPYNKKGRLKKGRPGIRRKRM